MLNPPPCISPLVGCDQTDTFTGNSSQINSSSSYQTSTTQSSSSSSSRAGYWSVFDSQNASSSSSSGRFVSQYSSNGMRLAVYTVTVKNRGNTLIQAMNMTHGPVPSGATFDAAQSTQGCQQNGVSTFCTLDLAAGETKTVTMTYRVNNSVSCALARILQTVTLSSTDAQGSVSCAMKSDTLASVSSSSSSSFAPVTYNYSGTTATTTNQVPSYTAQTIAQDDASTGKDLGMGKGYKPYYQPKTGALSDLFAAPSTTSTLSPARHKNEDSAMPISSTTVIGLLTIFILGAVFLSVLKRKNWTSEHLK